VTAENNANIDVIIDALFYRVVLSRVGAASKVKIDVIIDALFYRVVVLRVGWNKMLTSNGTQGGHVGDPGRVCWPVTGFQIACLFGFVARN